MSLTQNLSSMSLVLKAFLTDKIVLKVLLENLEPLNLKKMSRL